MSVPEESLQARQIRAAKSQSLFREANERILELGSPLDVIDFACECVREGCAETVPLTPAQYEKVRRFPTHFVICPGHDAPEVERVIKGNGRYAVVEKFGAAGPVAVRLDPRARRSGSG